MRSINRHAGRHTVQGYMISSTYPKDEPFIVLKPERVFRCSHIWTKIEGPELGCIEAIYVNESQVFFGPRDAYLHTLAHREFVRKAALAEMGIAHWEDSDLERYLDENDIELPDPTKAEMPTMSPIDSIRIKGRFKADCAFVFRGITLDM